MENELVRLSTFASFPKTSQAYPIRLAEAGFTYCGFSDEVKCPDCDLRYRNWSSGDLPSEIHKQLSPNCPFIVTKNSTKSIVNCKENLTTPQQPTKEDEHSKSICYKPSCDCNQKKRSSSKFTCYNNQLFKNLGISCTKPRYPEYAILVVRITSYRNWPRHLSQSSKEMAQAGFFYTDKDDLVRCFHCGGGLSSWDKDDDPFVEHAHWFPECIFLRQCKGDEFINQVKAIAKQQKVCKYTQIIDFSITVSILRANVLHQQEDLWSKTGGHDISSPVLDTALTNGHSSKSVSSKALNTSVAIESVLEMGYSLNDVLSAIENHKVESGSHIYSASDIMKSLLKIEEKGQLPTLSVDSNKKSESLSDELLNISETEDEITRLNTLKDVRLLQEENKQLRDRTLCKVCMEETVSIVFLPCGHLAVCHQCAPALNTCPLCRKFIKATQGHATHLTFLI
ncbi:hypothetical protein KUTeg_007790 [Tegillarca granosa]|uniref:RING-type domain-containing protein n=1 Tax=Tegillarca granosa TaxID=220873 RepID=A0ABQ9FH92_TEGGR|nr:hypothetical protein KUTeg_007790 [Tegillarca granosa]